MAARDHADHGRCGQCGHALLLCLAPGCLGFCCDCIDARCPCCEEELEAASV